MSSLYRLEDSVWAYRCAHNTLDGIEEIRMTVPALDSGETRYTLVANVARLFDESLQQLNQESLGKGWILNVTDPESSIFGRWTITTSAQSYRITQLVTGIGYRIKQFIPFSYSVPARHIVEVGISAMSDCMLSRLYWKVVGVAQRVLPVPVEKRIQDLGPLSMPLSWDDTSAFDLFDDPFTKLASVVLQTFEGPFVMETGHRGNYHFYIQEEVLGLRKLEPDLLCPDENTSVLRVYAAYLIAEFGPAIVSQLQESYGIDLDKMLEFGEPLLPDHVAKCNIGVNDIGMGDLEQLFVELRRLGEFLQDFEPLTPLDEVWSQLERQGLPSPPMSVSPTRVRSASRIPPIFPGRVRRRLKERCLTLGQLREFLHWLFDGDVSKSIREASVDRVNAIISLLMSTDVQLHRAFTGREIEHIAISGFQTMGNRDVENACRDLSELLQIFPQLRKHNDWSNFFELIAHVYSKKNLFRKDPDRRKNFLRIGTIIPGPTMTEGVETYFFTKSLIDDGRGCFSYALEPVCMNYRLPDNKLLPWLKVFRSTNSNSNAPHWFGSILADLNPLGAPGDHSIDMASKYEREEFEMRTIPLWVAHLVYAGKNKGNDDLFARELRESYEQLKIYLDEVGPSKKIEITLQLDECLKERNWKLLRKKLSLLAEEFREQVEGKLPQDIYFDGHSLGGGLAQLNMWYYLVSQKRLPVPGCAWHCIDFNGPAINESQGVSFLRFGRANKELMAGLGIRIEVKHQFEFGDFVPEGGQVHEGASPDDVDDSGWLDFVAYIFKPRPTAKALCITTLTTHGRRIGMAENGRDYSEEKLTQKQLYRFDNSWLLRDLRGKFGYRFLVSPKISEIFRRTIGGMLYYPMRMIRPFIEYRLPGADENGVFAISYTHTN